MTVRWGVIGACGIAERRTIPEGIAAATNSTLAALMNPHTEKMEKLAQRFPDARLYGREEDLLRDREVDAVYIATPTCLHCRQTVQCAEAGKHVFCEKPMAMNLDECDRMTEACRRNHVKLGFGFMMRYHAAHQKIRQMIESGELGQLVMGRAQLTCWYPDMPGVWRQDPSKAGGGCLLDMGTHCLDLLEMFLGEVREVCGFRNTLVHGYGPVEDTSTFVLRFAGGAHGVVDNYFNVPDAAAQNALEVYGTRGAVLCKGTIGQESRGRMTSYLQKQETGYDAQQDRVPEAEVVEHDLKPRNTYRAEIERFAQCILDDTEPDIPADQARRNLQIALACYEAADTGRTVWIG